MRPRYRTFLVARNCEARPRGAHSASQGAHACHSELRTGAGHAISKAAANGAPSCMQRPRRDEVGLAIGAIGGMVVVVAERSLLTAESLASQEQCTHGHCLHDTPVSAALSSAMHLPCRCDCTRTDHAQCSCLRCIICGYCERRRCDVHSPSPAPSWSAAPSAVTTFAPVLWQAPQTGAPRLSQSGGGAV